MQDNNQKIPTNDIKENGISRRAFISKTVAMVKRNEVAVMK
ncbi:hypothetical protein [Victivallis sp. Marseille-Q1083]|nr:hypothetical protein [Victivallis sp. Marseille-Q1083]